jgi:molybdenum cofactor cytidylyltransferase
VAEVRGSDAAAAISGILLAAGSSRRFGADNKLLVLLDGRPLVRHCAETLSRLGLSELICVTGPDADRVVAALHGLDIRFVHNDRHLAGMGGSVAKGIRAVSPGSKGALVCLGDMPRLPLSLLARLVEIFAAHDHDRIVFASLPDGSQRNPVLWPKRLFGELAKLEGEQGAKAVLNAHAGETIGVVAPPDAFLDIDTIEDLRRVQRT